MKSEVARCVFVTISLLKMSTISDQVRFTLPKPAILKPYVVHEPFDEKKNSNFTVIIYRIRYQCFYGNKITREICAD